MKISLIVAVALSLMACSVEAGYARQDWTGSPAIIPVPPPGEQVGPAKRAYGRAGVKKGRVIDDKAVTLIQETKKILDDYGLPNVARLLDDLEAALKKFVSSQVQRSSWGRRAPRDAIPNCFLTDEMRVVCQ